MSSIYHPCIAEIVSPLTLQGVDEHGRFTIIVLRPDNQPFTVCLLFSLLLVLVLQGVCLSPQSSEQLSLCYANRSASLYRLQRYQVSRPQPIAAVTPLAKTHRACVLLW